MKERELPEGWEWKRLGDISQIIMGQSPPGASYNDGEDGAPFLQGNAEFGEEYPKNLKWTTQPSKFAIKGSILFSVRAPVGAVNLADKEYCIGRGLASLSFIEGDNKYLYFLLKYLRPELERKGTGSTFKAVSKSILSDFTIPIPPLETQKKIVAILEKAERIQRLRKDADALTEQLLQSVFLEMFGDHVMNPMGWDIVKLEDVCSKITDGTHHRPNYVSEGIPFLSVKNITKGHLDFDKISYITPEQHASFIKRCKPEKDDILYTKVGVNYGIAEVVNCNNEFSIYVSLALLKPKSEMINSYFLKFILNSVYVKRQADRRIRGIGVPDLHLVEIKQFMIPLPPLKKQEEFIQYIDSMKKITDRKEIDKGYTKQLFAVLQSKAFKGELVT